MANRTTGPERGERGRTGQRPWQEDPAILERMQEGAKLRSQGQTAPEIALLQKVHISVVYEDRKRLLELRTSEAKEALEEHIENLRQQQREVIQTLSKTDRRSVNVAPLHGLLRQIEMDIAKLDGSLVDRREISGKDGGPIQVDAARAEILSRLDRLAASGPAPEAAGGATGQDG